jgi:hypothetical protein
VISNTKCTVAFSKLTASPFLLVKGNIVNIKVIAKNAYGDSATSDVGTGAVIQLVPDSPITLTNSVGVTDTTVIGFTWSDGASNGGATIIDYRITYDQSTGNYVVLETEILTKSYSTTFTITAGRTYTFRIEARNSVGYSSISSTLSVLAATVPN